MKRRNHESRARMRIIQEQHMGKRAQQMLDQTKRRTGASYVKFLEMYRAEDRIKASFISLRTQIAEALEPAIRNLTSASRKCLEALQQAGTDEVEK